MADNTFAKARNLGFLERGGMRTIKVTDGISSSDKADVYRFTIQPGAAFQVRSSFKAQGGAMNFSFFVQDPLSGQVRQLSGLNKVSGKKTNDTPIQDIPAGAPALNCFIRFDKPTQNVKYQLKITSL
jgi:hypothetical protein